MSDPWDSWVVGSDPRLSNSTSTDSILLSIKARARSPIRAAAAQWELEGPRITGPMTSLKMLGNCFIISLQVSGNRGAKF